ncbi:unnamed protein product [Tuber melanosporum]|uniref:(Perigord truffle) hypothetical protein n=1 Tax=Tuber melanosporum (strain Mel28) TaxID=656061 RepID=D5GII5_TUBMM|nr:uncharacterized protein GSTUM_00008516001 [Tuber melanosporum]CAZ84328.1 unnamed protein product [Tuber melanosporum]
MDYLKKKLNRRNQQGQPPAFRSFVDDGKFDPFGDFSVQFPSAGLSAPTRKPPPSNDSSIAPPPTYDESALTAPEPAVRRGTFSDTSPTAQQYAGLKKFDTVFLIDDSGSMVGSNWRQTSSALAAIVPICTAQDSDGVDIHFLNHDRSHTNVRSADQLQRIFASVTPRGITPTGRRLGFILDEYLMRYKRNRNIKPLNVIVITDGEPTDPDRLEKNIVKCARELDNVGAKDRQVGVQFFQVGNDEAATESLDELDNALVEEHSVRDMVDTVSWKKMNEGNGLTADGILKVVMGAVDKRLDRKRR